MFIQNPQLTVLYCVQKGEQPELFHPYQRGNDLLVAALARGFEGADGLLHLGQGRILFHFLLLFFQRGGIALGIFVANGNKEACPVGTFPPLGAACVQTEPRYQLFLAGHEAGKGLHVIFHIAVGDGSRVPKVIVERFVNNGQLFCIEEIFHNRLLEAYNYYLIIGGMPECVASWVKYKDPNKVLQIQKELIEVYENDFSKHNGKVNSGRILMVFRSIVAQLAKPNEKFMYGAVREGGRARDFEEAIEWLVSAGMLNRVYNVSKIQHPLTAFDKLDCFKLFFSFCFTYSDNKKSNGCKAYKQ